ncbi:MAG: hypothetical protein RQ752_12590, partial [Thermohalobaculum sp.]|nr:hypothetical protein [Thermohalobaculum sp.]
MNGLIPPIADPAAARPATGGASGRAAPSQRVSAGAARDDTDAPARRRAPDAERKTEPGQADFAASMPFAEARRPAAAGAASPAPGMPAAPPGTPGTQAHGAGLPALPLVALSLVASLPNGQPRGTAIGAPDPAAIPAQANPAAGAPGAAPDPGMPS